MIRGLCRYQDDLELGAIDAGSEGVTGPPDVLVGFKGGVTIVADTAASDGPGTSGTVNVGRPFL